MEKLLGMKCPGCNIWMHQTGWYEQKKGFLQKEGLWVTYKCAQCGYDGKKFQQLPPDNIRERRK